MLFIGCQIARQRTAVNEVALSGGVFQNKLVLEQLHSMLEADGFQVHINHLVPPNDGGLSLGQAAIAAARLASLSVNPSNEIINKGNFGIVDSIRRHKMCLGIPSQIVEVVDDGNDIAKVEVSGVRRNVSIVLVRPDGISAGD